MATYPVIEHYVHGAAVVYQRFEERGRMLPEGVEFVGSWVLDEPEVRTCYQVMTAETPAHLAEWLARWSDIVDFEVHRTLDSAEAAGRVGPVQNSGAIS